MDPSLTVQDFSKVLQRSRKETPDVTLFFMQDVQNKSQGLMGEAISAVILPPSLSFQHWLFKTWKQPKRLENTTSGSFCMVVNPLGCKWQMFTCYSIIMVCRTDEKRSAQLGGPKLTRPKPNLWGSEINKHGDPARTSLNKLTKMDPSIDRRFNNSAYEANSPLR